MLRPELLLHPHPRPSPLQACTLLLRTLAINGSVLRPELLLQLAAEAPTSCRDEIGGERALLERALKVRWGGGGARSAERAGAARAHAQGASRCVRGRDQEGRDRCRAVLLERALKVRVGWGREGAEMEVWGRADGAGQVQFIL